MVPYISVPPRCGGPARFIESRRFGRENIQPHFGHLGDLNAGDTAAAIDIVPGPYPYRRVRNLDPHRCRPRTCGPVNDAAIERGSRRSTPRIVQVAYGPHCCQKQLTWLFQPLSKEPTTFRSGAKAGSVGADVRARTP